MRSNTATIIKITFMRIGIITSKDEVGPAGPTYYQQSISTGSSRDALLAGAV